MAYGRGRRGVVRPRRKLIWARTIQPSVSLNTQITAAPYRQDLLSAFETAYGAQLIGCTVMRMRGVIRLGPSSAGTSNVVVAARIGDASELVGASIAQQSPVTDQTADWMMYQPLVTEVTAERDSSTIVYFDVKARRKLDELQQSLLLYAGGDNPAASTAAFNYTLSLLIALP